MSYRFIVTALTGLVLLAGCASTNKVMLGQARPPINPAQVQVYAAPPPGSLEIAQLEARSGAGFGTQGQTNATIARLKREAAAMGANGIVVLGIGSSGSPVGVSVGAGSYGRHFGGGLGIGIPTTQRQASGIAIYVPPGSENAPVPSISTTPPPMQRIDPPAQPGNFGEPVE